MSTICYLENNNSFAVEDWNALGVSGEGCFTSAVPIQRAPKKLVSFAWSYPPSVWKDEDTSPTEEYRAAIEFLFEHTMTKKEAAYFRREMASPFVPLKPEQTRLLPPRAK
jgi:hypothetical protein